MLQPKPYFVALPAPNISISIVIHLLICLSPYPPARTIRVPDTSKRIDPKTIFGSYSSSVQREIDSYPFPPGSRARKPDSQKSLSAQSQDLKAAMRRKIGMLPLSAHAAPKVEPPARRIIPQSDPIRGSSQSQGVPTPEDAGEEEEEGSEGEGAIGKRNALGSIMFGVPKSKGRPSGGDVFGPDGGSDDDLPAVSSLLTFQKKPAEETEKTRLLAEKKRALLAQATSRRVASDSDSDIELEVASQNNKKGKGKARILVRPGQEALAVRKPTREEVTESQVERAGHAVHFGRDAAQLGSSPVRGGGVYEESQFGRVLVSGSGRPIRPRPTPKKSAGKVANVSLMDLTRHAATRAQADGQARQKADEERWKATGGRGKVDREGGLKVEDALRQTLQGGPVRNGDENEEGDEEDEEDEDYRGSASESEGEDKENLPASGRARQPHEPVSDFDGSGGDEEADADKENSLELLGMGSRSPAILGARSPIQLSGLSPAQSGGLSPAHLGLGLPTSSHLFGRSPSHLHPHSRVSSSGSARLPLSELEDEEAGEGENVAVARAPLGELDVELEGEAEDDEEELPRRPAKRVKSNIARRLFDDEEEGAEKTPTARLMSPSQRRLGSPSQRRLGSPSRRLGSPTQRSQPPSARFRSPPSRLRSPLPGGTQSFSQVETQAILGGLGDVFGFESQMSAGGDAKDAGDGEGGGGLTQLFANAEVRCIHQLCGAYIQLILGR
jgi:hypothetical protein